MPTLSYDRSIDLQFLHASQAYWEQTGGRWSQAGFRAFVKEHRTAYPLLYQFQIAPPEEE
jgi:hypothetical protein